MNQNQTSLIAALFVASFLSACGEDSTTEKIVEVATERTAVVADVSELPKCNKDNEGGHAYVKGETSERICVDGKWFALKESEGVSDFDFSCTTKELKDKSGLKIICNGDSIGVVLNGAKGKDGANGKDGAKGDKGDDGEQGDTGVGCSVAEQTDSTVTIKCGEKSFDLKFGGNGGADDADTLELDSEKIAISLDTLSGLSQKGPFLKGSMVYLYELSDGRTLKQTNGNFTSVITSDDGRYTFQSRDLASQYALIVVDGKYRNEVTGKPTSTAIKLQAYTNMLMRKSANVNLLTHLEKDRVFYLVTKKGMTVRAAKKQAQAEIFKQFYIDTTGFKGESEDLDVFGSSDADAALLAISILLQGDSSETALSVLLTEISNDMATDGKWDGDDAAATKAAIADGVFFVDLPAIRKNVEGWGLSNGKSVGEFEKLIENYIVATYGVEACGDGDNGEERIVSNKWSQFDGKTLYCFDGILGKKSERYFNPNVEYGGMIDKRTRKLYRTVAIGGNIWMAENLNYEVKNSYCYNNSASYAEYYGRLYTWSAAVGKSEADCYDKYCTLPAKVQGICPEGWHLPSKSEWEALLTAVGGQSTAGKILLSQKVCGVNNYGVDSLGFSTRTAGHREPSGNFDGEGYFANFWSSTQDGSRAYHVDMGCRIENVELLPNSKSYAFSVRCVKDEE